MLPHQHLPTTLLLSSDRHTLTLEPFTGFLRVSYRTTKWPLPSSLPLWGEDILFDPCVWLWGVAGEPDVARGGAGAEELHLRVDEVLAPLLHAVVLLHPLRGLPLGSGPCHPLPRLLPLSWCVPRMRHFLCFLRFFFCFCCGSGSADPYLRLTDPDPTPDPAPDPGIFVSDLQDDNFFASFFVYYFLKLHLLHISKIKVIKKPQKQ